MDTLTEELVNIGRSLKWGGGAAWVRSVVFKAEENTISFEFHPPCSCDAAGALLLPPLRLHVYFPESPLDAPFCFSDGGGGGDDCDDDDDEGCVVVDTTFIEAAAAVAEAGNGKLSPLAKGSLLLLLSVLESTVEKHRSRLWPAVATAAGEAPKRGLLSAADAPDWAHRYAAAAIASRMREDLFACELSLALLSMALHSPRRHTIASPLPGGMGGAKGDDRSFEVLVAALSELPRLSTLTSAESVFALPVPCRALLAAALLAAPVRYRTLRPPSSGSGGSGNGGHGGGSNGSNSSSSSSNSVDDVRAMGAPVPHCWAEVGVEGRTEDWAFEALRRVHGAREGFHGSSPENFHAIAHKGLKNLSGTKQEKHGAVFGEGVYLAVDPAVSQTFARATQGHRPTCFRQSALCATAGGARAEFAFEIVARCEVIDLDAHVAPLGGLGSGSGQHKRGSSKDGDSGDYLVVKNEGHIHLRSLLLFRANVDHAGAKVQSGPGSASPRLTRGAGNNSNREGQPTNPQQQQQQQQQRQLFGLASCWAPAAVVAVMAALLFPLYAWLYR